MYVSMYIHYSGWFKGVRGTSISFQSIDVWCASRELSGQVGSSQFCNVEFRDTPSRCETQESGTRESISFILEIPDPPERLDFPEEDKTRRGSAENRAFCFA